MICEYWDIYIVGVFNRRIHYYGFLQSFTKELDRLEFKYTIEKGEFYV